MTTIISLAARDFIAVGCDSLATTSYSLAYPHQLSAAFFEPNGELKRDAGGNPLLKHVSQIWDHSQLTPVNQLPSVTKLYDLEPIRACLLFAGASRIGETTLRELVETFKAQKTVKARRKTYTMAWLAETLKAFIADTYQREIPEPRMRPMLELILSGYSAKHREPEVWRLEFAYNPGTNDFDATIRNQLARGQFNVVFGGQYDVIQRIVNGIDAQSWFSLRERTVKVLDQYHDELIANAQASGFTLSIPKPNFRENKYNIFGHDQGGVTCLNPDCGSLSEQAGIDFVHFLINVMIKSQEFSSSIPTVGGRIHVALLRKNVKFQWISREAFTFENERIPIFQDA